MFLPRRPTPADLERVFLAAASAPFNYQAGPSTQDAPPPWFFRNHHAITVGSSEVCFQRAAAALRAWQVTRLGWCEFLTQTSAPRVGQVLVARAFVLGLWPLHPSRIVAVEEEARRYSFTLRTLKGHEEKGEEQFAIDWLASGEVRFTIRSYSRPARLAGWFALPYVRHLQRRFGRETAHVLQSLV